MVPSITDSAIIHLCADGASGTDKSAGWTSAVELFGLATTLEKQATAGAGLSKGQIGGEGDGLRDAQGAAHFANLDRTMPAAGSIRKRV